MTRRWRLAHSVWLANLPDVNETPDGALDEPTVGVAQGILLDPFQARLPNSK